jgi:hypothetical protein
MPIDMAVYMANRRAERRRQLIELAGGACARCGAPGEEFNHRDRTTVSFRLSGKGLDGPWESILIELAKCELLCRVHHREYTKKQYTDGEIRPWNDKRDVPYVCGTARKYQEQKCKCPRCKTAKAMYRAKKIKYDEVIPL